MCSSLFYYGKYIYIPVPLFYMQYIEIIVTILTLILLDSPLCDLCGVIEDAIHYFYHNIKYFYERQVFNDTVRIF